MKSLMLLVGALAATTMGAAASAEPLPDDPPTAISSEEALETIRAVAPEALAPDPRVAVVPTAQGFAVAGAASRTAIDDDPAGGFSLATAAGRLDVEPEDVGFDAGEVVVVPGTDTTIATDTSDEADTLTRPIPGGVETFTVIRGPGAPVAYTWRASLPDGVTLRHAPDGGVYVLRDGGAVVARVLPPWARDANGRAVPIRFSVEDDRLTMTVDHLIPGVTYPVIADPPWILRAVRAAKKAVRLATTVVRKSGPVLTKVAAHPVTRCLVGAVTQVSLGDRTRPAMDALTGCASGVARLP